MVHHGSIKAKALFSLLQLCDPYLSQNPVDPEMQEFAVMQLKAFDADLDQLRENLDSVQNCLPQNYCYAAEKIKLRNLQLQIRRFLEDTSINICSRWLDLCNNLRTMFKVPPPTFSEVPAFVPPSNNEAGASIDPDHNRSIDQLQRQNPLLEVADNSKAKQGKVRRS